MRLSQYHRDQAVRTLRADIPDPGHKARAEKLLVDHFRKKLPPTARAAWDDPDARHHVAGVYVYERGFQVRVPGHWGHDEQTLPPALHKQLEKLREKQEAFELQRSETLRDFRGVLASCTTLKQAKDRLPPELHKYLPGSPVKPPKTLPAPVHLTRNLKRLGWKNPAKAAA